MYTLNIVDAEGVDELIERLRSQLASSPAIAVDRRPAALRFVCETWRPILVERVDSAIDAAIGAAERQRRFRPL